MKNKCTHAHGEYIGTLWLCGQCYEMLNDIPKKYFKGINPGGTEHRQLVIHAPTSKQVTGYSLEEFVMMMANHLAELTRGSLSGFEAISYAVGVLDEFGIEFGDKGYGWGFDDAKELIREDMTYWDDDDCECN